MKIKFDYFMPSSLNLKILFWLFFSILFIQIILLIPYYYLEEKKALSHLKEQGLQLTKSWLQQNYQPNADKEIISDPIRNSIVKGLTLFKEDGTPVLHKGEKIDYPTEQLPFMSQLFVALRTQQGNRHDVLYEAKKLGLPFDITARLDSSHVQEILNNNLIQKIVEIFFMTIILTFLSYYIMRFFLLKPFLQIINLLNSDVDNPKILKKYLKDNPKKKKDDVVRLKFQVYELLKQLKSQIKTIKAHEAILALSVEERTKVLEQINNYNTVTGLPNRNLLIAQFSQEMAEAQYNNKEAVLFTLEIRDFHEITNTFGQDIGILFLKEITKILMSHTPKNTVIAHLTTTRFAIARNSFTSSTQILNFAQWILDLFNKPFIINAQRILTAVNVGIAIFPSDGLTAESLLVNANLALSRAKADSPNSYQFYEAGMNQVIEERRNLLIDLHTALEDNQFLVYYQPQVNLNNNTLFGFEALIRWQHPTKGLISPAQFIPLAEESGLITQIGEHILRSACKQMKNWHNEGYSKLGLAVNLSTVQFKQKNIVEIVNRVLMETALEPQYLELEITESGIMSNLEEAIITMKAFHNLGVRLSIDDFGTGHSSLSYLKQFPIQKLKIDQSFVRDLGLPDPEDFHLNHSNTLKKPLADIIITLGHSLNLQVIAEGIETAAQCNYLKEKGCDEGQGYYFGLPTPLEEMPVLFQKFNTIKS